MKCTDNYIYARIFNDSRLYSKINDGIRIFIYPVLDARIFYQSLKGELKTIYTADSQCYIIPDIHTYVEGIIKRVTHSKNYKRIEVKPLNKSSALELLDKGYSRADGCLIELMVYYTKLQADVIEKNDYCKIYYVCSESVKRSTSREYYLKILDELRC
ncbi:MAG: DUF447 family protein [Desulfurococcales archaeon]|nr:DUF447 family protein [Desulfurococcales archaeon]